MVMTGSGGIVELQATAEKNTFSRETLDRLIDLASSGIEDIMAEQLKVTALEIIAGSHGSAPFRMTICLRW